ncbi:hypothetical protein [Rhizobium leguminosarum]|uniref:hypothetical protein n=1 Tax=Rhizobium leguminosarum TaxID=384 RepID=UPI001F2227AD|nr:hypothetical protein [Rhizobium leguminosarum]UIJ81749.1 hypothetical protein LZK78_10905 [Rhizobium leguminosarum]
MAQIHDVRPFAVGGPVNKPRAEEIRRRIANACLRLERRNVEAKRGTAMELFERAVSECVDGNKRQSVRDCYRQLQWTVLNQGVGTAHLPSESTFRRCAKRELSRRSGITSPKARAAQIKEIEAVLLDALLNAFEVMPDRTVRLRSNRQPVIG